MSRPDGVSRCFACPCRYRGARAFAAAVLPRAYGPSAKLAQPSCNDCAPWLPHRVHGVRHAQQDPGAQGTPHLVIRMVRCLLAERRPEPRQALKAKPLRGGADAPALTACRCPGQGLSKQTKDDWGRVRDPIFYERKAGTAGFVTPSSCCPERLRNGALGADRLHAFRCRACSGFAVVLLSFPRVICNASDSLNNSAGSKNAGNSGREIDGKIKQTGTVARRFVKFLLSAHWLDGRRTAPRFHGHGAVTGRNSLYLLARKRHPCLMAG